ncbi:uncharacterized protein MONOS_6604 [Monocercomonoides exilis]|uniref:uncharacterized protein n=1 Tax=Monocercomonoides exilis TaxID=2049356 RepID=UPI003559EB1F|nr:hypothetical protein MONOS_6604 [Monocercomonoides exilis]|eukprot:MONOS_6604.1-p1 / transcript=MONOS_6604.1 / gene=MONOS_6604 / organism=Monocercomonoides_exilis_PA203 / gene_product=unspecified product / transcript_product=unspecified product / location=Mono_scaffold00211:10056-10460(+) / protein_length=135 / sequence_SO=supercontig / SO=protein_coding / is_pseudo=false
MPPSLQNLRHCLNTPCLHNHPRRLLPQQPHVPQFPQRVALGDVAEGEDTPRPEEGACLGGGAGADVAGEERCLVVQTGRGGGQVGGEDVEKRGLQQKTLDVFVAAAREVHKEAERHHSQNRHRITLNEGDDHFI